MGSTWQRRRSRHRNGRSRPNADQGIAVAKLPATPRSCSDRRLHRDRRLPPWPRATGGRHATKSRVGRGSVDGYHPWRTLRSGFTTERDPEGELSRQIRTARTPRLGHFAPLGVPASNPFGTGSAGACTTLLGQSHSSHWRKKVPARGECHGGTGGGWTTDVRKLASFSETLA